MDDAVFVFFALPQLDIGTVQTYLEYNESQRDPSRPHSRLSLAPLLSLFFNTSQAKKDLTANILPPQRTFTIIKIMTNFADGTAVQPLRFESLQVQAVRRE